MDLDIINEYIFMKHNIIPGSQKNSIVDVARNHLGLHSARIMTPYTTLCSRLNEYKPDMLTSQLYEEKNLIKMRCMRTTLHMVPMDIASILHMATLDLRLAECKLFYTRNDISIESIEDLEDELVDFVNETKFSYEIENKILERMYFIDDSLKKDCAKKTLKYFWEKGLFCYVNTADNWENEERKYAITKIFYPDLDFQQFNIEQAQKLLVYEYIKKFGPATIKDLSWWSGLSIKTIREIINNYQDTIVEFRIKNLESEFYMLATEFEKLEKYKPYDSDWIALLAYEDPSLKGYYESRSRYVNEKYYNLLFNQIGEVRASIMYNGKAIGIWEWDKKYKRINLQYFYIPNQQIKKKVEKMKEYYEYMLNPNRQITLFDSCF